MECPDLLHHGPEPLEGDAQTRGDVKDVAEVLHEFEEPHEYPHSTQAGGPECDVSAPAKPLFAVFSSCSFLFT